MVRNRTPGIKAFESLQIPLLGIDQQMRISLVLHEAYEVLAEIDRRQKELDALLGSALNGAFSWLR